MIKFSKFTSIENHYREKYIRDMLHYNPIYNVCKYVVHEKIDGACFQFRFTFDPTEEDGVRVEYGKRTSILEPDEKFYNYQAVVSQERYKIFIKSVKDFLHTLVYTADENKPMQSMIFYGEIFGRGIQNRINYGDIKNILFYDIKIDDVYLTQRDVEIVMKDCNAMDLMVPIVGYYDSFEDALAVEVEGVKTMLNPDGEKNLWEGIVIKPYDEIAVNDKGEQILFYVKKKAEKFKDKEKVRKRQKKKVEISDNLKFAQEVFDSYITENRLKDMFAKEGMIENTGQIGKYIKLVVDDAREDFLKDHSELYDSLDGKEQKKVSANAGKILSKLCFKYV